MAVGSIHNVTVEEQRDEILLDRMTTPGGPLELVAYRARGTVWVGVRPEGSSTKGAIGLHTGSNQKYLETTAWIERGWGVAFGAVSPEAGWWHASALFDLLVRHGLPRAAPVATTGGPQSPAHRSVAARTGVGLAALTLLLVLGALRARPRRVPRPIA